jgi:hypothetical protein
VSPRVEFEHEADAEYRFAGRWYEERREGLGDERTLPKQRRERITVIGNVRGGSEQAPGLAQRVPSTVPKRVSFHDHFSVPFVVWLTVRLTRAGKRRVSDAAASGAAGC